jgi:hypothetical protein
MIKRLSLIITAIICFFTASAQNWGGGIDDEDIHFGFSFQYLSAEFKLIKNPNWRAPYFDPIDGAQVSMPLLSISSQPSPGFGLGFVFNKRFSENLDARVTPSLVFSDRIVSYEYENAPPELVNHNGITTNYPTLIDKKIQATMFEFPAGIKLKSNRLHNFRAYMLGGVKYSIDIASKKKTYDEGETAMNKFLKSKRNYLSYEAGIGFDLYFEYFKMSPELKLSYSPNSLLQQENNAFSTPINKMMLRQFTFSLFFE